MDVDADGSLLVATVPARGPLAGAVLRIDTLGRPARGNPDPASPVLSRGISVPGGVCVDPMTRTIWVTDRSGTRDVLHRVTPGTLGPPAWTWPDAPGVAGCAVLPGTLAIAERRAGALFVLRPGDNGTFTGDPQPVLTGAYGQLSAAARAPDGLLWLGTVNRDGVAPAPPTTGSSASNPRRRWGFGGLTASRDVAGRRDLAGATGPARSGDALRRPGCPATPGGPAR